MSDDHNGWRVCGGELVPQHHPVTVLVTECPDCRDGDEHSMGFFRHVESFSHPGKIFCQPSYHVLRFGERPSFAQYRFSTFYPLMPF